MKKRLLFVSLAVVMVLFSCKKEDDPSPYDAKYADEAPEVSKAAVEQNAIDLVNSMEDMTSATAIEVLMNLNNLQSGMTAKSASSGRIMKPLTLIASITGKDEIAGVLEGLKEYGELLAEEPETLSALFDSAAGKYTYDFETGEFIETAMEDVIIVEFPGKETDLTNTAVITVDNFSVVEITEPADQVPTDFGTEFPKSIRMVLTYNNTDIAGASFAASYTSTGLPTKVTVEVWLDDFTITTTAVHSPFSSASWRNTMKYKSDILLETFIAAKGNWSEENISENIVETEDGTDVNIQEIIKNANAHVILMNVQVVGTVNIKGLADAMEALEENTEITTEEEYAQAAVDVINANAKLVVIYRDTNTKIAEAEAYVVSEYDEYYGTTDYYPSMRFVYSDGSVVDVETYVNYELEGFYTSVNNFIDQLNADYNLDLEYIYPPIE